MVESNIDCGQSVVQTCLPCYHVTGGDQSDCENLYQCVDPAGTVMADSVDTYRKKRAAGAFYSIDNLRGELRLKRAVEGVSALLVPDIEACQLKTCHALLADANAEEFSISEAFCGDSVTVKCKPCFEFPDGDCEKTYSCGADSCGEAYWNEPQQFCQLKSCGEVPADPSGEMSQSSAMCGEVVTHTCDACYEMPDGSCVNEHACEAQSCLPAVFVPSDWQQCQLKTLSVTTDETSTFDMTMTTCGSPVTQTCLACYEHADGSCTKAYNAIANPCEPAYFEPALQLCQKKQCTGLLPDPNAEEFDMSAVICPGSVTVVCKPCHRYPDGSTEKTYNCNSDVCEPAAWDQEQQFCQILDCVVSNPHTSSSAMDESNIDCGQSVVQTCLPCYHVTGGDQSECENQYQCVDQEGSVALLVPEIAACKIKTCPSLVADANAEPFSLEAECGESVTVKCLPCYRFPDGSEEKTYSCSANQCEAAYWDQPQEFCQLLYCSVSNPHTSSSVMVEDDIFCGNSVPQQCLDCYKVIGGADTDCENEYNCQDQAGSRPDMTALLLPDIAACEIKYCPALNDDANAEAFEASNIACGEGVTVTCKPCYRYADGSSSKTYSCSASQCSPATWDQPQEYCQLLHCPPLEEDSLTKRHPGSIMVSCGSTVEKECNDCSWLDLDTYTPLESYTCLDPGEEGITEGVWDKPQRMCFLKQCFVQLDQTSSYEMTTVDCGEEVIQNCNECYHEEGIYECVGAPDGGLASFSPPLHNCTIKECPGLADDPHASCESEGLMPTSNVFCGHQITLNCDQGWHYPADGSLSITYSCYDNGEEAIWDREQQFCKEIPPMESANVYLPGKK